MSDNKPPCFGFFNSRKECKHCPFGMACRDAWLSHKYTSKKLGDRIDGEVERTDYDETS